MTFFVSSKLRGFAAFFCQSADVFCQVCSRVEWMLATLALSGCLWNTERVGNKCPPYAHRHLVMALQNMQ